MFLTEKNEDRQMLIDAAAAAGWTIKGWVQGVAVLEDGTPWQPLFPNCLTDFMGDAFRLAIALDIDVTKTNDVMDTSDEGWCTVTASNQEEGSFTEKEGVTFEQAQLAACRAIVRAAAHAGKHAVEEKRWNDCQSFVAVASRLPVKRNEVSERQVAKGERCPKCKMEQPECCLFVCKNCGTIWEGE